MKQAGFARPGGTNDGHMLARCKAQAHPLKRCRAARTSRRVARYHLGELKIQKLLFKKLQQPGAASSSL
jgi:hypothetical protein